MKNYAGIQLLNIILQMLMKQIARIVIALVVSSINYVLSDYQLHVDSVLFLIQHTKHKHDNRYYEITKLQNHHLVVLFIIITILIIFILVIAEYVFVRTPMVD